MEKHTKVMRVAHARIHALTYDVVYTEKDNM